MKQFLYILLVFLATNLSIEAQNYKTHKVKSGETIEQIAKRYNVTPYDIISLNPDSKKELKVNSVLIIPKSRIESPKAIVVKELKGFKQHKVKRRETLYSLAKKYDVELEDIKKHNTFLYANNLKKGDRLKIPVFSKTLKVEETQLTKLYKVKAKEGKWRVAYKFGISIDELEALNPSIGDTLQVGQELKVPNIQSDTEKVIDETFDYYTVLPREGYYRLKLKLDVNQETLEALNPGLKESGLKAGMVLKTPKRVGNPNVIGGTYSLNDNRINLRDSIYDFSTKRLAIMLPFKLNSVDLDSIYDTKQQIKRDSHLRISLDFYSGVLFALDSLKKLGVSVKTDVYDTENRVSEVSYILNTYDFKDTDAVIGPLTSKNFDRAAAGLQRYNVPIVSPITQNVKLYDNVFQSRPPESLLQNMALSYVKRHHEGKHIVIISDAKHKTKSDMIKREFISASQLLSNKDDKGKDQFNISLGDLTAAIKPGDNIVFLETQNEGFASSVISFLNSLRQEENKEEKKERIDIVLTTTNFNRAFQGEEISNYHLSNLQFLFASTSKPYESDLQNPFIKEYEATYGVTPNNYTVRGFDLTMDVVLRLVSSESIYSSVANPEPTEYVENKFAYTRNLTGGYYNNAAYLVKYNDLKIVEVVD